MKTYISCRHKDPEVLKSFAFISEPDAVPKSCHSTKIGEKPVFGSKSIFLGLPDPDPYFFLIWMRVRILTSKSQKITKNLDFCSFVAQK